MFISCCEEIKVLVSKLISYGRVITCSLSIKKKNQWAETCFHKTNVLTLSFT